MVTKAILALVILFPLLSHSIFSQTFVAPVVGMNFSNINGYEIEQYGEAGILSNKGIEKEKISFGISASQYFSSRWSAKITSKYSLHSTLYIDNSFVGFTDFKFTVFDHSIIPLYNLNENINIGLGLQLNQLRNYEIGKEGKEGKQYWARLDESNRKQNGLGWVGSISYLKGPITLDLRYSSFTTKLIEFDRIVRSIHTLELFLSYRIKVATKCMFNNRKKDCPKF